MNALFFYLLLNAVQTIKKGLLDFFVLSLQHISRNKIQ